MDNKIPSIDIDSLEDGQAKAFRYQGIEAFAVKQDGQVHAYENTCPHLQISLNFMPDEFLDSEKRFIMCANHGALFEIETGLCVSGPCAGESLRKINL